MELIRGLSMLAYLLRALSLELINSLFRKGKKAEVAKPALRRSFWIALSRSSIHFMPITVFGSLVYANFRVEFIGGGFTSSAQTDAVYLALFQVAAKVQETLCVASLTSVVLQALRHELLGDGVPMGMLGSGIWFGSISAFWSPEYLSASSFVFKSAKLRRWRLYILITVAGALAAVVGPAAAVMMLPRVQSVPAGGTNYVLNGTSSQFWPTVVDSSTELSVCSLSNATQYAVCPSGGYDSWRLSFNGFNYTLPGSEAFHPLFQLDGASGWPSLLVQSPKSLVPPVVNTLHFRSESGITLVNQPHAASAILQQKIIEDWRYATLWYKKKVVSSISSIANYKWASSIVASAYVTSPWVRTRCSVAQNLSAETDQASFPYLYHESGRTSWAETNKTDDVKATSISSLERNATAHLRAQWMPLPMGDFGISSLGLATSGLLVELPWSDDSRLAVCCSVAAAWRNGTITSDTSMNYDAWSNTHTVLENDSLDTDEYERPVTLDKSWLSLLTPQSPDGSVDGSWTPNTLERILYNARYVNIIEDLRTRPQSLYINQNCVTASTDSTLTDTDLWNDFSCNKGNKRDFMELVLGTLVADGLSRYGSSRVYHTFPSLQDWTLQTVNYSSNYNISLLAGTGINAVVIPYNEDVVVQRMNVQVTGYAYNASSATDYLSAAVACVYMLIAGSHLFWVLWYRVTSSSWDTITELLVLCQNSAPVAILKNTSTGIERLATYRNMVKIRAVPSEHDGQYDQLTLVFEKDELDVKRETGPEVANGPRLRRRRQGQGLVPPGGKAAGSRHRSSDSENAMQSLISSVHITATAPGAATPDSQGGRTQTRIQVDKKYS